MREGGVRAASMFGGARSAGMTTGAVSLCERVEGFKQAHISHSIQKLKELRRLGEWGQNGCPVTTVCSMQIRPPWVQGTSTPCCPKPCRLLASPGGGSHLPGGTEALSAAHLAQPTELSRRLRPSPPLHDLDTGPALCMNWSDGQGLACVPRFKWAGAAIVRPGGGSRAGLRVARTEVLGGCPLGLARARMPPRSTRLAGCVVCEVFVPMVDERAPGTAGA